MKKEIKLENAKEIILALPNSIWLLDQRKYMERAFEIAVLHRTTVYDSLFIACALVEDAKLVSCDKKQLEVASLLGIEAIEV